MLRLTQFHRVGLGEAAAQDGQAARREAARFHWLEEWRERLVEAGDPSLDEFLAWAGRETGRKIVYSSADAAREAEQTQLKGSTSGLSPEAAVAAVFASQPALHHVISGGQIRIERADR